MRSPYPATRIPVDYTPALPGAPRERVTTLRPTGRGKSPFRGDPTARNGNNAGLGTVWGASYRGVTSRKALKRPAWRSNVAGGQRIEAAGV